MTEISPSFILHLSDFLGRFKDLKRTGWLNNNVLSPESDAEHSFSLAFTVLLLTPPNLNRLKCLQLALIHDIAEVYCGDIIPGSLDNLEKMRLEQSAMERLSQELESPELMRLFKEYQAAQSPEAKFVKALDKVDNVLTADYYDRTHRSAQPLVHQFAASAQSCLETIPQQENEIPAAILRGLTTKD